MMIFATMTNPKKKKTIKKSSMLIDVLEPYLSDNEDEYLVVYLKLPPKEYQE